MTPFVLFLYVIAIAFGLFVAFLLCLVGAFLFLAGRGWLNAPEDDTKKPVRRDPLRLAGVTSLVYLGGCLLLWLGSKL